jgi:hypothetical protein
MTNIFFNVSRKILQKTGPNQLDVTNPYGPPACPGKRLCHIAYDIAYFII